MEANQEKKYGTLAIENNVLEVFENRNKDNEYVISFTCPEYTSLCPRSGFPDFATLYIDYIPGDKCIELKALKLWLNSFRNTGIYHEDITNHLVRELVAVLNPKQMRIVGDFTVRGNVHTVICTEWRNPTLGCGIIMPKLTLLNRDY